MWDGLYGCDRVAGVGYALYRVLEWSHRKNATCLSAVELATGFKKRIDCDCDSEVVTGSDDLHNKHQHHHRRRRYRY